MCESTSILVARTLVLIIGFLKPTQLLAQEPRLVIQDGHSLGLRSLCVSHDGKLLASGGAGGGDGKGRVVVWHMATQRQLHRVFGELAAFCPSNSHLLATATRSDVYVWDLKTGKQLAHEDRFGTGKGQVSGLAFSPDGTQLAVSSGDDTTTHSSLLLYGVPTLELKKSFPVKQGLAGVAFGGQGKVLATHCTRGGKETATLWNVERAEKILDLPESSKAASALAFSPKGDILVGGGTNKKLRQWSVPEGKLMEVFQYAADEVPQLAKNIGGIQKPLIAAPRGTSFDIGRLSKHDTFSVSAYLQGINLFANGLRRMDGRTGPTCSADGNRKEARAAGVDQTDDAAASPPQS